MSQAQSTLDQIRRAIRNVPDFPQAGIQFKDITPVLASGPLFAACIDLLASGLRAGDIDTVVGIDARGFIFAAAVALKLEAGFVPVRKTGKLPYLTYEESYDLEYGANTVAIHQDALAKGSRVLLVDDLLATGGTAAAAAALVKRAGGNVWGIRFLIELAALNGRQKLEQYAVRALISF